MDNVETFDMHGSDPVIGILFPGEDGTSVVFDVLGWQDATLNYGAEDGPEPIPGTGRIVRLSIASAPEGVDTVGEAFLGLLLSPWGARAVLFPCDTREEYVARLQAAGEEAGLPTPPPLTGQDEILYAQPGSFTRVEDLPVLVGEDAEGEARRLGLVPVIG